MSKFDYMEFGYDACSFDQLVFHARKYTKEQAVEIFNQEYGYLRKKCTTEDISKGFVRHYFRPTQQMSSDFEGPCYGFTDKDGNGAFPVWVITLAELEDDE